MSKKGQKAAIQEARSIASTLVVNPQPYEPRRATESPDYEVLWRDEQEAGKKIRRQRDEALDRAEKAENALSNAESAKLGKLTVGQVTARGRASGLHMATKVLAERSDLLRGTNRNKVSIELDMLARDVDALAEIEKKKAE